MTKLLLVMAASFLASFLGAYVKRKGENWATSQDVARIQENIENIKAEFSKQIEAFKAQFGAYTSARQRWEEAHVFTLVAFNRQLQTIRRVCIIEGLTLLTSDFRSGSMREHINRVMMVQDDVFGALWDAAIYSDPAKHKQLISDGYEVWSAVRDTVIEVIQAFNAVAEHSGMAEAYEASAEKRSAIADKYYQASVANPSIAERLSKIYDKAELDMTNAATERGLAQEGRHKALGIIAERDKALLASIAPWLAKLRQELAPVLPGEAEAFAWKLPF